MGNRHHHKKLRSEVRARMARTGESYQRALSRILGERAPRGGVGDVDLVPLEYFGVRGVLATFEIAGGLTWVVFSSRHLGGPFPRSPLFGLVPGGHGAVQ